MNVEKVAYQHQNVELEGHLAYDANQTGRRPVVLIAHAWAGQSDFERGKAKMLAELGYAGFALDMYGKGVLGSGPDENSKLMTPFVEDRGLLRDRMLAGLEAARGLEIVDPDRVGAIGFCFGGMCVLDLARSGADVRGVVSFHGLLGPNGLPPQQIGAKVVVLHGHDDPMAPPDHVQALATELTQADADWQIHQYGNTLHAFTNPAANDRDFGTVYDPAADRRSHATMRDFFAEVLTSERA